MKLVAGAIVNKIVGGRFTLASTLIICWFVRNFGRASLTFLLIACGELREKGICFFGNVNY